MVSRLPGGHLPTSVHGTTFDGFMHITDVYPTLLGAGVPEDQCRILPSTVLTTGFSAVAVVVIVTIIEEQRF